MPRILGVSEKRAEMLPIPGSDDVEFIPVETKSGIKVISLNLLTEEEDQPVIWRGPLITGVLTQMYTDTKWDELDFLLIDMPPGTGDVALTVMQSLPVDGMVVASIPQDMITMIVKKAVIMKLSSYYSTSYLYKDGKYYKSMDGKPSLDKETGDQISVTNLVIQKTSIILQKDNKHMTIKLVGKGTGYFISNGEAIEIIWERKSLKSQTIIKDSQGNTVPFNVGNTWWNVISTTNNVVIK